MTELSLAKIYHDWSKLFDKCQDWRRRGLKIVFTNGVFDILHPGHFDYLAKAKELGDRLIVGLNSDSSVKRLKGDPRPLIVQEHRAFALSCLRQVDAIVIFKEDTPKKLITLLRPDVLVKGADYTEDQIVGADEVKSAGGKVHRVPLLEGLSTSSLIDTIKKKY
ncbi:D-glycero-beta-D-manno-heptose 1-phosphate adenylyltransferase [candidate division LCP-89 bacterium B3_LCP]|uniref:D-glycero-beta-D-manno-heptose 1-phosphate adenylyltransferase n=1 Tax=candidate division LCP-89 bacterium B3_LCP TaxID=2012998 RepID=A0A532UYG7_UNCL8|nr:MAG: D-glycero-beta-D-manno-heptose 1-phosphate adenylyltransferase [candidate division LCP-89 bacterium B3_LCP]